MDNTTHKIHIPTLAKPTKDSFDIRPKKISEWVSALPKANIGETTRHVYQALTIVSHLDISAGDRLRFLEQINEPVTYIFKSFNKHFLNLSFPLPEKRRKVIRLTLDIYAEVAMGYKIPIINVINHGVRLDKKNSILAIHHALFYLGILLEKHYQVYAEPPSEIWFEIHQLYYYARNRKLNEQKIIEPESDDFKSSIEDIYKRILLLAIAQPNHLRQGEISKISQALKTRWGNTIQLLAEIPEPMAKEGLFVTDTNSATPPIFQALYQGQQSSTSLGLEISQLLSMVHAEIGQAKENSLKPNRTKHTLDQELLARLLQAWQISHKRAYPRLKNKLSLDITIGLSCTHHFMTQGIATDEEEQESPELKLDNTAPQQTLSDVIYGKESSNKFISEAFPSIDNAEIKTEFSTTTTISTKPQHAWQTPSNTTQKEEADHINYVMQQWTMVNLSAGGYCLMWDKMIESQAQVGELIGIHEQKNAVSHWSLGVIRWLRCHEDCGIEIGIQVLAPKVTPIQLCLDNNSQQDLLKGFLLPGITAFKQPQSLITPTLPFQVNSNIKLSMNNITQPARLTRLMENTTNYRQFLFSLSRPTKPINLLDSNDDDDGDSVWSSL